MRKTIFLCMAAGLIVLGASHGFSQDAVFNYDQSGMKRVWLDAISEMSSHADFESGNYRLDPDFRLGYGDTLRIDLEGRMTAEYEVKIDRKGNVVVPNLGKIGVMGLTLQEAEQAVEKTVNEHYANVEVDVTLADVRDIRVYVMGNVENPGTYAVSPFTRVMGALIAAGGPNEQGSLINIKVIRDGEEAAVFNAYDFFRYSDHSQNIRLKHGDIVQVCEAEGFFTVKGDVRYPGIYEMAGGARLSGLIKLAGGMIPTKFKRRVLLLRMNAGTQQKEVIEEFDIGSDEALSGEQDKTLEYDDTVIITTAFNYNPAPLNLYKNISLKGELVIPGDYLAKKEDTLASLLKKSAGVKSTAFVEGAVFIRESLKKKQKGFLEKRIQAQQEALLKQEARLAEMILTPEEREMRQIALQRRRDALNLLEARMPEGRMIIDLKAILSGDEDLLLQDGDSLFVPQIPDSVLVAGAVYNPQAVFYRKGKGLDYYLNAVGGANKEADREDIYVIKADGRVKSSGTGYGEIGRGDVIVVPEKDR